MAIEYYNFLEDKAEETKFSFANVLTHTLLSCIYSYESLGKQVGVHEFKSGGELIESLHINKISYFSQNYMMIERHDLDIDKVFQKSLEVVPEYSDVAGTSTTLYLALHREGSEYGRAENVVGVGGFDMPDHPPSGGEWSDNLSRFNSQFGKSEATFAPGYLPPSEQSKVSAACNAY